MKYPSFSTIKYVIFIGTLCLAWALASCAPNQAPSLSPTPYIATETVVASSAATAAVVANSPTATSQPSPEPIGCLLPSTDYTLVTINGHKLSQRTYEMLAYAQSLYGGPIDLTGTAITQGSYTNAVEASFGTHAGGGAVDLSVMSPGTYAILEDEIEPLIHALRLAGFAAWYRDFSALYEGSPAHIHAIAIGDRELSLPAREQLAGPFGYFWGYDGIPREGGIPHRDPTGAQSSATG